MNVFVRVLGIVWTSPNSLLGAFLGLSGVLFGGKMKLVQGAVEFHGGFIRWMLKCLPNRISAITLGHTILGQDEPTLEIAREHEQVHVRQYERWGPFFIPAYLLSSLYLKLVGQDPYYDNPFEKQAYAISSPDFSAAANDREPGSESGDQPPADR